MRSLNLLKLYLTTYIHKRVYLSRPATAFVTASHRISHVQPGIAAELFK